MNQNSNNLEPVAVRSPLGDLLSGISFVAIALTIGVLIPKTLSPFTQKYEYKAKTYNSHQLKKKRKKNRKIRLKQQENAVNLTHLDRK